MELTFPSSPSISLEARNDHPPRTKHGRLETKTEPDRIGEAAPTSSSEYHVSSRMRELGRKDEDVEGGREGRKET